MTALSAAAKRPIREAVFARDGHRCLLAGWTVLNNAEVPRCYGHLTVHHLWKASQGGKYEQMNLVTLCQRANDWMEEVHGDTRLAMIGAGLIVTRTTDYLGSLTTAWGYMRAVGLVTYTWDGDRW